MIEKLRGLSARPVVAGKHVLSVFLVSGTPCFVGDGGDFSRAVVSLVEGDGDEAARG